jgi:hypothetical protein
MAIDQGVLPFGFVGHLAVGRVDLACVPRREKRGIYNAGAADESYSHVSDLSAFQHGHNEKNKQLRNPDPIHPTPMIETNPPAPPVGLTASNLTV